MQSLLEKGDLLTFGVLVHRVRMVATPPFTPSPLKVVAGVQWVVLETWGRELMPCRAVLAVVAEALLALSVALPLDLVQALRTQAEVSQAPAAEPMRQRGAVELVA